MASQHNRAGFGRVDSAGPGSHYPWGAAFSNPFNSAREASCGIMSGVELGLAIVGVLHVCYTCGRELVNTIQAFREADTRLVEFIVRIEAC